MINAAIELPVAAPQNSKTQNVAAIAPKNINKVIKTKATGLITAEIKNLNPKAAYNFSISAKTNKGWGGYMCSEKVKAKQCAPAWYMLGSDGQWRPQV